MPDNHADPSPVAAKVGQSMTLYPRPTRHAGQGTCPLTSIAEAVAPWLPIVPTANRRHGGAKFAVRNDTFQKLSALSAACRRSATARPASTFRSLLLSAHVQEIAGPSACRRGTTARHDSALLVAPTYRPSATGALSARETIPRCDSRIWHLP